MKQEFYTRLREVIRECEEHYYRNSEPLDMGGLEVRVSKKNLGTWTDAEYNIMFNQLDAETERLCNESKLNCRVYCDRGGFMYLIFG